MANTSQNGYSVDPPLNKKPFPGTKIVPVPGVRKGDVATVLHYIGKEFDNKVEKLKNPGCWGYANRPIRGSSVTSNHASGTAIDLNAPKHPLGAKNTFTPSQKGEIRKILKFLEGSVRWGGDYPSRKDEMHFEINASPAKVSKISDKIKDMKYRNEMIRRGKWLDKIGRTVGKDFKQKLSSPTIEGKSVNAIISAINKLKKGK